MPEASYIPTEEEIRLRAAAVHLIFVMMKNKPVPYVDFVSSIVIDDRTMSVTDVCDILAHLGDKEANKLFVKMTGKDDWR